MIGNIVTLRIGTVKVDCSISSTEYFKYYCFNLISLCQRLRILFTDKVASPASKHFSASKVCQSLYSLWGGGGYSLWLPVTQWLLVAYNGIIQIMVCITYWIW